jgi:alkylhydroperoxidase family enzyme
MRQGLDDELYQRVGQYYEEDRFTPREKLAIEYAERFSIDHLSVDDELWGRLREEFSDPEVLELTVLIGFCIGIGRAYQVLDIARDFDVNWSREPKHEREPAATT